MSKFTDNSKNEEFLNDTGVTVAESKINGFGVFAARDFSAGQIILPIDDSRIVDEEHPLRPEFGELDYHCDYLADGKVVYLNSPERYINSSCDPNVFVKTIEGTRHVAALKPIKAGEELTCDYIIDCHGGIVWQCGCGSEKCRKTIVSSFFELPIEKQLEYLPLLNPWFIEEHEEKVEALNNMQKMRNLKAKRIFND